MEGRCRDWRVAVVEEVSKVDKVVLEGLMVKTTTLEKLEGDGGARRWSNHHLRSISIEMDGWY